MSATWTFIWLTFALVFLGLEAAIPFPDNRFVKWGWLGLFCFVVPAWWTAQRAIS